jgi:hypothetical protein
MAFGTVAAQVALAESTVELSFPTSQAYSAA